MEIFLAVVAVTAVAAAGVGVRWWVWSPLVKRRVMVQTDAEVAFTGVVMSRRGPLLVLADVTVSTGDSSAKADGQVIIDRDRVLWIQRVM